MSITCTSGKPAANWASATFASRKRRTVPVKTTLRQTQRLHRRFGQIINEDRRGSSFAQILQHQTRLVDIGRLVRMRSGLGVGDDLVSSPQGADHNRIVLMLAGEAQIVGKGRGDAEVNTAPGCLAPQKIGFHLDVAIPEQHDINASFGVAKIFQSKRGGCRPIGLGTFLHFPPIAFQKVNRIAPICFAQFPGQRGHFFVGIFFG
jgi:hypothetical protein